MNNKIILTQENQGFNLNGEELSRDEVTLFFDLLGFAIDHRQDDIDFFENAQISLQEVSQEEFARVWDDFVIWNRISDVQRESKIEREKAYVETI